MSKMLLLAAVCLFSLVGGSRALDCLGFHEMEYPNLKQLKGQWWEYQTFNVRNIPNDYECMVANFYKKGADFKVVEDFIKRLPGVENTDHTRKEWTITRDEEHETFRGWMETAPGEPDVAFNYYVIDTDYKTYLITAVCSLEGPKHPFGSLYVMTRKQTLSVPEANFLDGKIRAVIRKHPGGKRGQYTIKDNNGCKPAVFLETN